MSTSISYGPIIYKKLAANEEITKIAVDGYEIFPVIAEAEPIFPYIVYNVNTYNVEYTMAGEIVDNVLLTIKIVTKNYKLCCSIAEVVRKIFELNHGPYINSLTVSSITESFLEDAYIKTLVFEGLFYPMNN